MWILVDVDDPSDVGKNEKRRVIISDIIITPDSNFSALKIHATEAYDVHPATPARKPKEATKVSKTKSCKTCKYQDGPEFDGPCRGCSAQLDFNHWEEKEEDT